MKWLFLLTVLLLPLAGHAQDFHPGTPPGASNLTADETAKLVAVRRAVLTQHPELLAARTSYYQQLIQDEDAYVYDPSIRRNLAQLQMQIEEAMKKLDPTVAPVLAKLHNAGSSRWGNPASPAAPAQPPVPPPAQVAPVTGSSTEPAQVNIPPQ